MPLQTFDARLERPDAAGSWTYVRIPFSVPEVFGAKGQLKVRGTINGQPYRSSAMPEGDGSYFLVVNKALRDAVGVTQGDVVRVEMEPDGAARFVDMPDDLRQALSANDVARAVFDKLAYSHQKAYVDWICEAKTEVTRERRVRSAIERLKDGATLK
jgi:hypothetical protein